MIRNPKLYALEVLALALLLALTVPVAAQEIKGTLTSIEAEDYTFSMFDDSGNQQNLRLRVDGTVLINGEESEISDLQAGDEVTVTVEFENEEMVATLVRATRE